MSKLSKFLREAGPRFRRMIGRQTFEDARVYVGTDSKSGEIQFEFLRRQGLTPSSNVLEVGCGFLNAGCHLMRFLEPGRFVGIDPNEWVREKAMEVEEVRALVEATRPTFLSVDDFDASSLGIEFDHVLSHSILSHAAGWQLGQFLKNVGKVLAPEGRIVASLRLAEGNPYGNRGSKDGEDTNHPEWRYPGGVCFKKSTVIATADEHGLVADHVPLYTEMLTKVRPSEIHDWIVFSKKTSRTPLNDRTP